MSFVRSGDYRCQGNCSCPDEMMLPGGGDRSPQVPSTSTFRMTTQTIRHLLADVFWPQSPWPGRNKKVEYAGECGINAHRRLGRGGEGQKGEGEWKGKEEGEAGKEKERHHCGYGLRHFRADAHGVWDCCGVWGFHREQSQEVGELITYFLFS